MHPLTEPDIRASFVNCTKGEAKRLPIPKPLEATPWPDLDYLGWIDQGSPEHAYLVTSWNDRTVGITLRTPPKGAKSAIRTSVCALCLTTHSSTGVTLFTARKAGTAGRQGNTRGTYICSDLACSLYLRGKRRPEIVQPSETLSMDEKILRVRVNLDRFLDGLMAESPA
ncbi:FBP domain-containing protein [Actinokineospora sp. G85]|uniref:FBP domain-containing protein n=1 Tax=Actinokineospora sp. G85 TaxID=3406626 RepID=UPI003C720F3C